MERLAVGSSEKEIISMTISHYSRSKKMLEKMGYAVWKTEQPWNRFTKVRRDLFNLMDAIAIDGKGAILGVQVTSDNKGHEHLLKALSSPFLPLWLKSGGRFEIHDWRKLNQRGRSRLKWEVKITVVYWDSLGNQVAVKR